MTTEFSVFISSKMQELAAERQVLHELLPAIEHDLVALKAWVFEDDAPASNMTIREVYLDALQNAALYIGLFWNAYGEWTIDEFQRATEWGIDRHIYVKNVDPDQRDPQLQAFLEEQSDVISGITPKWFTTLDDLREQISRSIAIWIEDRLQRRPGDSSAIFAEFSDDIPDLPQKLIGRDELVANVEQLLEDQARVLLHGFGGMGKTALAATVAANWLDDDRGSVLWLRAGSEDGDTLLEALARPFERANEVASASGNARLKVIRRILADNEITLLVLDDVWNGTALSQLMKAAPRRMPVLVTARQRYALDDILDIGRLAPVDAATLLGHYARQNYRDDNDARELCRQLGYHAFALEVAGKTIKVDQIAPSDLLARIVSTPHDMAMPEDFAEEGRSSITELLDASLYALDEQARRAFVAMGGLFVQRVTPELLGRYMNDPAIEEALTTLQRRGLAERSSQYDKPYYYLHNLAYSYARAIFKRRASRKTSILYPNIVYVCLDYAEDAAENLDALDIEIGNLLGAAEAAYDVGDAETLVRMMSVLTGIYLAARGHTLNFLLLLDAAIAATEHLPDCDETRHFLLSKCGNIYFDRNELATALACYQAALTLAEKLGMEDREVILLCVISKVRTHQEADDAATYLEKADALANALDNDFLRGFVLEFQAYHAQMRGDYGAARDYYAQEVALAESVNDVEMHFTALANLGSAEKDLGQTQEGLKHHTQALQIARTQDNRIWMAYALQGLGEDYLNLGENDQARQHFEKALALFRESGIKTHVAMIESYLEDL